MAQVGVLGVPGLNLVDSMASSYGPKGEMSPEAAIAEQALNRRRQIAHLLMQKGLAGSPGGKMVGRFYVADSPLQHGVGLLQTALGAYLANKADKDQSELAKKDWDDAASRYRAAMQPDPQPSTSAASAMPPYSAPMPPIPQQGPYNGEVGGIPQPEVGVQSKKPPIPATPPPVLNAAANMQTQGLAPDVTPGDMSQFAHAPQGAQIPTDSPPQPAAPPMPAAPDRSVIMRKLSDLLLDQHPAVRARAQFELAVMQKQDEIARADAHRQEDIGRDMLKFNTPSAGDKLRADETRAVREMTDAYHQAQLGTQLTSAGIKHADDEAARKQAKEIAEMQANATSGDRRYQSDIMKQIAGMKVQGQKDVAEMKAAPGAKMLPASVGQKFLDNSQNLRMAENALNLISGKDVNGAKGDKDATGAKGYLPDAVLQRVDPKGVDTRAAIANLGSMVIHDRSGAAVTAAEFPRLRPFIPTDKDRGDVVAKKLSQFVAEYRKIIDDMHEFYTEAGYKVPTVGGGSHGGVRATPNQEPSATVDGLPDRATQIGTSGGKPVYQTPDGKRFIGE